MGDADDQGVAVEEIVRTRRDETQRAAQDFCRFGWHGRQAPRCSVAQDSKPGRQQPKAAVTILNKR